MVGKTTIIWLCVFALFLLAMMSWTVALSHSLPDTVEHWQAPTNALEVKVESYRDGNLYATETLQFDPNATIIVYTSPTIGKGNWHLMKIRALKVNYKTFAETE